MYLRTTKYNNPDKIRDYIWEIKEREKFIKKRYIRELNWALKAMKELNEKRKQLDKLIQEVLEEKKKQKNT